MNANELRIGNYVMDWTDKRNIIETKIDIDDFICFGNYLRSNCPISLSYKPIPLTEEWLLRFGFEKSGYDYWSYNKNDCFELRDFENGEYCYCVNCGEYDCSSNIKYVHELQNLFFTLTGKEL